MIFSCDNILLWFLVRVDIIDVQFDFRTVCSNEGVDIAEQTNPYENTTCKFPTKQFFINSLSYFFLSTQSIKSWYGKKKKIHTVNWNSYKKKSVIKIYNLHVFWVNFKCVNIKTVKNDFSLPELKPEEIFPFQTYSLWELLEMLQSNVTQTIPRNKRVLDC